MVDLQLKKGSMFCYIVLSLLKVLYAWSYWLTYVGRIWLCLVKVKVYKNLIWLLLKLQYSQRTASPVEIPAWTAKYGIYAKFAPRLYRKGLCINKWIHMYLLTYLHENTTNQSAKVHCQLQYSLDVLSVLVFMKQFWPKFNQYTPYTFHMKNGTYCSW